MKAKDQKQVRLPGDSFVAIPCFNDWKRFCAALREIASGQEGSPLTALEAQRRARAVLVECGYSWPGQAIAND